MDLGLHGQVAVVTGASRGIGLAVVRALLGEGVDVEQWASSLMLNLMAAVRATRAALPVMLAAGHGVVVTIGSVNAGLPDPTVIDYSAAKAALTNFAKSLSKEVGPRGVRVATVHPGPVGTDLWLGHDGVAQRVSQQTGLAREEVQAAAVKDSATHRFTRPQEVADLVVMLASARLGNLTGAGVTIDGGLVPTL